MERQEKRIVERKGPGVKGPIIARGSGLMGYGPGCLAVTGSGAARERVKICQVAVWLDATTIL